MQIENMDTMTNQKIKADKDPLQFACHPLSKLEFIADTIKSMGDYCQDTVEISNPHALGEIIADATMELWAITNAGMERIDALEAQLRVCSAVASSSTVNDVQGGAHVE